MSMARNAVIGPHNLSRSAGAGTKMNQPAIMRPRDGEESEEADLK